MRTLYLAAALLPLVSVPAAAQSWYAIGGNEKTAGYVDLDSIRPLGDKTIAVVMSVYATPMDGDVKASTIRQEYDCAGNYFRTLEYGYYGVDKKLMSTEPSLTINEHKTPAPNSINEAYRDFICYRKGGRPVADPFADAPRIHGGG